MAGIGGYGGGGSSGGPSLGGYGGGGSSGGSSLGGYGAASGGGVPAKAKPKPKRWAAALLEQLEQGVRSIPAGAVAIGKAIVNDVSVAAGGGGSFQFDDIAKAAAGDIKDRYAPLFRGDFAEFKEQLATRPLDFLLDGATILTGGGAAAGKGGQVVVAGARAPLEAGSIGARMAKLAGYVERSPDSLAAAKRVYGAASKEVRQGEAAGLVRGVRRQGEGRIGTPGTGVDGGPSLALGVEKAVRTNPVLARRDAALTKVLDRQKLDKLPVLGLNSQAARGERRSAAIKRDVRREALLAKPAQAVRKLSPDEQTAWFFLHTGTNPLDYASLLEQTRDTRQLDSIDRAHLDATLEWVQKPEVRAAYQAPSERLQLAVQRTQRLADEQLPEMLKLVSGLPDDVILERRLLQQRKIDGATTTTVHPEQVMPDGSAPAQRARRELPREQRRREQRLRDAEEDLRRSTNDAELVAKRLRAVATMLLERITRQDAARAELRRPAANKVVERTLSREDALREAPGNVRRVPEPGDAPEQADVERMIARMRRNLTRGEWGAAREQLRAWLATVYSVERYGAPAPTPDMVRAEASAVARARRRRKQSAKREVPDVMQLRRVVDGQGAWSRQAVKLVDGAGPNRERLWNLLRQDRAGDDRFVAAYPTGSLERALAARGIHPTERTMNPVDDPIIAETVEQWLDEELGGAQLLDVALGARGSQSDLDEGSNVAMDQETAQALMGRAALGNDDLPRNPTNDEVADGIGAGLVDDDSAADTITQAEFVDRATDVFLRVFELGEEHLPDAAAEFGRIRGDASRALARELGIGDRESGVVPTGEAWVQAIRQRVEAAGFDERYREAAVGLAGAQRDFEQLGTWAFRDERFVPDPDQTDFGTVLEFVPEIDDALREKLATDAEALTGQERATLHRAARSLEAAAKKAEAPNRSRAVLRQRIDQLGNPSRREQRLVAQAESVVPVPLKGAKRDDGTYYSAAEFVNPESGRLLTDEFAELTDEEKAAAVAGKSYAPHLPPVGKLPGGGGLSSPGAARGAPSAPSNVTHASVGHRFETGTFSMNPMMLLEQGERLVRSAHALDLWDAATLRGIAFDRQVWADGGSRRWLVLNTQDRAGLSRQLTEMDGMLREIDALAPEQGSAELHERLRAMDVAVRDGMSTDGLVMVPRDYFEKLSGDLKQSSAFARMVIDKPLDVFRTLVLFLRPAYYVNNVVGQHFLLMVKERGPAFVPAYVRFLAQRGQVTAARELLKRGATDVDAEVSMLNAFLDAHAGGLRGASAYSIEVEPGVRSASTSLAMSGSRVKRGMAAALNVPAVANRLGSVLSDDLVREFRFWRLVQPHVKAARAAGETGDTATIAMRLLDSDPVLKDRLIEQTLEDLIDYRGMSSSERLVLRRIVPFYGWLRGIARWSTDIALNQPGELAMLNAVANVGEEENAEWNERVPEWLQGAIRIGGEQGGMQRVINTQGVNPLGTIADLSALARGAFMEDPSRSLVAGTSVGQINPFLRSLSQALFNKGNDFSTGMPMLTTPGQSMSRQAGDPWAPPGAITAGLMGWLASTPQAMLATQWNTQQDNREAYGTSSSPNAVYQSPFRHYVWSYAGLPMRQVSLAGAEQRRQRDEDTAAGVGGGFG